MKKKPTKHFVPNIDRKAVEKASGGLGGIPAGHCFGNSFMGFLPAWEGFGEVAKTRRDVNCGNCKRTKVFRKVE